MFFLGEVRLSTALCDLKIAVWGQTDVFYSSSTSEIRLGRSGLDIIGGGATQRGDQKKYVQMTSKGGSRLKKTSFTLVTPARDGSKFEQILDAQRFRVAILAHL